MTDNILKNDDKMNFEKSIHTALWGLESWENSAHPYDSSVIVDRDAVRMGKGGWREVAIGGAGCGLRSGCALGGAGGV